MYRISMALFEVVLSNLPMTSGLFNDLTKYLSAASFGKQEGSVSARKARINV